MIEALTSSSSGPSVSVHGWIAVIIVIGGITGSLLAIGGFLGFVVKVSRPLARVLETLIEIANQFRPNSGSSLHDTVVRIEEHAAEAVEQGKAAKTQGEETHAKLEELWDYTHDFKHDVVNGLSKNSLSAATVKRLAEEIGPRPQRIDDPPRRRKS